MENKKCECMRTFLDKVKESVITKLKDNSYKDLDIKFRNTVFYYGEDSWRLSISIPIDIVYRQIKKDGTPYKKNTLDYVNASIRFCPFCGIDYKMQQKEK